MVVTFGEVFENAWDCDHCGTKGISALKHKTCPVCGAAAPGPDKEYIADPSHPLTDFTDIQLANEAPDWTCRFCQTRNAADKTACTQCGNSRSEADQTASVIDYGASPPTAAPLTPFVGQSAISYKPDKRKRAIIAVAIVALVAILGTGAFFLLHTTSTQGRVVGFSWNRLVNIELYQTVQQQGRFIPAGAQLISSHQVIDHYNNTYRTTHVSKTCYKNNGNGSSKSYDCGYNQQVLVSSIPVYATEYIYTINVWKPERTATAGSSDHNPYWPQYSLAGGGLQVIGGERVSNTTETYLVMFIDSSTKQQYTLNTSQQEWAQYQVERSYPLVVNFRNEVVNDPLKPEGTARSATASPTATLTENPAATESLGATDVTTAALSTATAEATLPTMPSGARTIAPPF